MFPQAMYFPIRTLYLSLKIEQRERYKSAELAALAGRQAQADSGAGGGAAGAAGQPGAAAAQPGAAAPGAAQPDPGLKATPSMWRCSRIMHMQREIHPTILSSLEGVVDQV